MLISSIGVQRYVSYKATLCSYSTTDLLHLSH